MKNIAKTIAEYNKAQTVEVRSICDFLESNINTFLKKNKSVKKYFYPLYFIILNILTIKLWVLLNLIL